MQLHHTFAVSAASEQALNVYLISGKAPAPFADSCQLAPRTDGALSVFIDKREFKFAQQAGRIVASFGLFDLNLKSGDETPLTLLDALYFIQGLYDYRHELKVSVPDLKPEEQELLALLVSYVIKAREIGNTEASLASPQELGQYLLAMLEEAAAGSQGSFKSSLEVEGEGEFSYAGLRAVGAGSAPQRRPCMVRFEFTPEDHDESVDAVLVGKGITFDTGGYDLKPPKFMAAMRTDKCGAVYLACALALALKLGLKKHVVLYLPLTDNAVSGAAMKPGDIIFYKNGISVEVNNTDAEGRLILADGLIEAAALKPKVIIDAATLTGAAKNALGRDITAYFCDDEDLGSEIEGIFKSCCEDIWRLPQRSYMLSALKSKRADLKNSAEGVPGASSASLFLKHFAGFKREHLHFDLSSAYAAEGSQYWAGGVATGSTVLSIAAYLSGRRFS